MNSAACSLVLITWCSEELAIAGFASDFLPSCFALRVSAATLRAIVCFIPKNSRVQIKCTAFFN